MTLQGEPEDAVDVGHAKGTSGRPGSSYDAVRAVTIGVLLAIAAGMLLDAAPTLSADQRLIAASIAVVLASLLGLSGVGYRRRL